MVRQLVLRKGINAVARVPYALLQEACALVFDGPQTPVAGCCKSMNGWVLCVIVRYDCCFWRTAFRKFAKFCCGRNVEYDTIDTILCSVIQAWPQCPRGGYKG